MVVFFLNVCFYVELVKAISLCCLQFSMRIYWGFLQINALFTPLFQGYIGDYFWASLKEVTSLTFTKTEAMTCVRSQDMTVQEGGRSCLVLKTVFRSPKSIIALHCPCHTKVNIQVCPETPSPAKPLSP